MSESDIPVLDGWVPLSEAADLIGISRQHAWRMATASPPKWKTVHRVGTSGVYVVSLEEVEAKRRKRARDTT